MTDTPPPARNDSPAGGERPTVWTAEAVAGAIGATIDGDGAAQITGVAAAGATSRGDLTFAVDPRRVRQLATAPFAAAIVPTDAEAPAGATVLRTDDPEAAFARFLQLWAGKEDLPPVGVDPSAVVHPTAQVAADAAVGPGAVIGEGAAVGERVVLCANVCVGAGSTIGDETVLMPGAVVRERCTIGRRCRLHANCVIGTDGFGYYTRDGVHHRIHHAGTVEIGDDVEIGACSCVDRAKFGATRIGDGAKIDNMVQIAHNVQIGAGVLLAAQVGIAGSSRLGDYVVLGGHVGVRDNVQVGDGVRSAAFAAIARDVEAGQVVSGIPAIAAGQQARAVKIFASLPELKKQLRRLQARVDALEDATGADSPQG